MLQIKSLFKEPLVHFLIIGFLMFVLYGIIGGESGPEDKTIQISRADIQLMQARWQKQWQRPPTDEEMKGLIRAHVREEVLYREAMAMGLDQNDTIVRRRVAQKMDFVLADATSEETPTDEQLEQYMQQNIERFQDPVRISFAHVYFSQDKRGDKAEADAKKVLETIRKQGLSIASAIRTGDPFMMYYEYSANSRAQVARNFGEEFADALFKQNTTGWLGPVRSGYGLHLIYVSEFRAAIPPVLEDVKERVLTEYLSERGRDAKERAYQKLLERYTVEVEKVTADAS
jgi:peptidyl-prolyl cis-trans isomerase C